MNSDPQQIIPDNPNLKRCYLPERLHVIVLAAGHPWGVQTLFSRLPGVAECVVGYANGNCPRVDFNTVDRGKTGFAFAVRIKYDPDIFPLSRLLSVFFKAIDPTARNHQGPDYGSQYRSGVYYLSEDDLPGIEMAFREARLLADGRVTTELSPLRSFILAEEEQQNYLERHPDAYCSMDLSLLNGIKGMDEAGPAGNLPEQPEFEDPKYTEEDKK